MPARLLLRASHDLYVEVLVQAARYQGQGARALRDEAAGHRAGPVTQPVDNLLDAVTGLRGDVRLAIDHTGNGLVGNASLPGNILNGDSFRHTAQSRRYFRFR